MEDKCVERFFKRMCAGIPIYFYESDLKHMSHKFKWCKDKHDEMKTRLRNHYESNDRACRNPIK